MSGNWIDAAEAALNAVLGDHLDASGNRLSIPMGLFDGGHRLADLPEGSDRLVVLVHGMGCTETCWAFEDPTTLDYGRRLEREHGLTPLYVRYNTGLDIRASGRALSALLGQVVATYHRAVSEITLIGHSLGGLVIRRACYEGRDEPWSALVRRAFYLGSPHLGSPWERAGRVATSVMKAIPDPVVKMVGDVADVRSVAIKQLGRGAQGDDQAELELDPRFEHYVAVGSLPSALAARLIGDGLVPEASALEARSSDAHVGRFEGIDHMSLCHRGEVYDWISERCGPGEPADAVAPRRLEGPRTERLGALLGLLTEAVDAGSSAVQRVQEDLTARPYDVLERIPGLAEPARAVRAVHFGMLRGSYGVVRFTNGVLGAAFKRIDGSLAGGEPGDQERRGEGHDVHEDAPQVRVAHDVGIEGVGGGGEAAAEGDEGERPAR